MLEPTKLKTIIEKVFTELLHEAKSRFCVRTFLTPIEKRDRLEELHGDLSELNTQREENSLSSAKPIVHHMLEDVGEDMPETSPAFHDISELVSKYLFRLYKAEIKMIESSSTTCVDVKDILNEDADHDVPALLSPSPQMEFPRECPGDVAKYSLESVVNEFVKAKTSESKWCEKTSEHNQMVLKILLKHFSGKTNIQTITKSELRNFRDSVLKEIKPNSTKKALSSNRPVESDDRISLRTVNNYTEVITSFFSWAVEEELVPTNRASSLKLDLPDSSSKQRESYSNDELKKILTNLKDLPVDKHWAHRYWVPIIAMFHGMRLNEICQLQTTDIYQEEKVWCFDINNHESKRLKNKQSIRKIPISPILLDLGFIDYLKKIQAKEEPALFPGLTLGRDGHQKKIVNWYDGADGFNRRLITKDPKKTFHSMRHSFATAMRKHSSRNVINCLTGWEREQGMGKLYIDPLTPAELFNELSKLDFGFNPLDILQSESKIPSTKTSAVEVPDVVEVAEYAMSAEAVDDQ